jgi:hypothetical protein
MLLVETAISCQPLKTEKRDRDREGSGDYLHRFLCLYLCLCPLRLKAES